MGARVPAENLDALCRWSAERSQCTRGCVHSEANDVLLALCNGPLAGRPEYHEDIVVSRSHARVFQNRLQTDERHPAHDHQYCDHDQDLHQAEAALTARSSRMPPQQIFPANRSEEHTSELQSRQYLV